VQAFAARDDGNFFGTDLLPPPTRWGSQFVMLSEAKHLADEILRDAQDDATR